MVYNFSCLNVFEIVPYQGMTYPFFYPRLRMLGRQDQSPILAVGAQFEGEPVGLALAEIGTEGEPAALLSIFTAVPHRRKGIATKLIDHVECELYRRRCKELKIIYEKGRLNTEPVEGLLQRCQFPPARVRALICRCNGDKLKEAPWLKKSLLPAVFEIFLWKDLSAREKQSIQDRQKNHLWYPEMLSPFKDEPIIEPLNSLGLRYKGEVVGWQINHRIAKDTIRYTCMFVREDLQPYGLAFPLMIESIKRHVESEVGQIASKATFVVPWEAQGMIQFVKSRMAPYIDEVNESVETTKRLERK